MLFKLQALVRKADGTKYHSLFNEIYHLTLQIEDAYRKRYPDNENKIVYFHERYTRAFVDAYSLLMQNLLVKPLVVPAVADEYTYANYIAEKITSSKEYAQQNSSAENVHADWMQLKKQMQNKQMQRHDDVWSTVNSRKASKRRSKSLLNAERVTVDTDNNLTWFKFPGEKEVYKLMQSAPNPIFINEINNRYFRKSGGFCDKVVNYFIEESGKVILVLENDSYFLIERDGKGYNPYALSLKPVYFTINNEGGVYEREQLKSYIQKTIHRVTDGSIVREPDFKKLLWKAYVYDNMRWALYTKEHEDVKSTLWANSYGDNKIWASQRELFESIVQQIQPSSTQTGNAEDLVFDKIRAYDRAIDYMYSKRILSYSDHNHHIL